MAGLLYCALSCQEKAMIRGAIESVSSSGTFGWIWSPEASVRGRTVLAFLDDVCIGDGTINGFRQDLKDAGLGDGYAGFNFNLSYPNPADAPRVIVKLEGSDMILVQRRSRIAMPGGAADGMRQLDMSMVQWMRGRGWLSQSDFDFLRFFRQFGVYERSLVVPKEGYAERDRAAPLILDPAATAESMLGLTRFGEAVVKRESIATPRDWRRIAEQQEAVGGPGVVLCLWSSERGRLPVIERSHVNPPSANAENLLLAGTAYSVGFDRLVFLDARIVLGEAATFPAAGLEVFYLEAWGASQY
jgi:hypothetical protein